MSIHDFLNTRKSESVKVKEIPKGFNQAKRMFNDCGGDDCSSACACACITFRGTPEIDSFEK